MNAIVSMLINGKVCHQTVKGVLGWDVNPDTDGTSIVVKNDEDEPIAEFWNVVMIAFEDSLDLTSEVVSQK